MKTLHTKKKSPFLSIIVLTRLTDLQSLQLCLRSIKKSSYQSIEIVLVINGYSESRPFPLSLSLPCMKIIRLPDNRGLYGYVVGAMNATAKNILFLDDDCTVQKKTLYEFARSLRILPKNVGIISATVYDPIHRTYQYSFRNDRDRYLLPTFAGGASVIRKEVFLQVGYYDQSFFLWMHEDDFALRAISAGYLVFHSPDIIVHHHNHKVSFRSVLAFTAFRNKAWLNIKHFSLVFWPLIIMRDLVWIALYPIRVRTIRALFFALFGYLWGYLTSIPLWKQRICLPTRVQQKYVQHYLQYRTSSK